MRQNGINNNRMMGSSKTSLWDSVGGKALPASVYVLIYTAYCFAFSNNMSSNIIRPLYVLYFAMTGWYIVKSLSFFKSSKYLYYLGLLLLVFVVYGMILYLNGTSGWKAAREPSSFLLDYVPTLLPLFVFYYFGRREIINEQWFKFFIIFFLCNTIMLYLREQGRLIEKSLTGDRDYISNSGYLVASLLPLVCFLNKRKILQYIMVAGIVGFTIFCFKRGAILCVAITLLYFIFTSLRTSTPSKKILVIALVSAVFFVLYGYTEKLINSNEFFYMRINDTLEGNTSGRDNIMGFFINYFFSAENGLNFLWGNGAYGTVKIYGIEAHSDWLEFAIDFGLLGLFIYIYYWKNVYKNIVFADKRISAVFYTSIMMCFIFNFSRTFFSMSIGEMSFVTASILGSGMGLIDSKRGSKSYIELNI